VQQALAHASESCSRAERPSLSPYASLRTLARAAARTVIIAVVALTAGGCAPDAQGSTASSTTQAAPAAGTPDPPAASSGATATATGCHAGDPLAGVYRPQRLRVVDPCATVHGVVDCIRSEPDGDLHIRLRLDDADRRVLTPGNDLQRCPGQPGAHLVVEVIPQHCGGVPQRDADDNCADRGGFTSPSAPAEGRHVAVTGPLVIDEAPQHGQTGSGWAEIHPAEGIAAG
jgi:hypothetical protein